MATFAAGALMITLAGCGNSSKSAKDSSSNDASSSKVVKSAKVSNKKAAAVAKTKQSSKANNNNSSSVNQSTSSSVNATSNTNSNSETTATSDSSTRAAMTAQDAKNIVKEHIGNQLNNAGISGKKATGLPTIDEVDGYTAVQNGVNDWTVSGNGHSFHITSTSVTGK